MLCHGRRGMAGMAQAPGAGGAGLPRPAPDMPGYYYDPEKRKYFKIARASNDPRHPYRLDNLREREREQTPLVLYRDPRPTPSIVRHVMMHEQGAICTESREQRCK